MAVAVLIGLMISLVVGPALIPTILTTIDSIDTAESPGIAALVSVLPYIFVAIILIGAVAWIGSDGVGKPQIPERLKRWRNKEESTTETNKLEETSTQTKKTQQTKAKYNSQCKSCKNYTKVNGIPWCLHHDTLRDPFDPTCEYFI